MLARILEPELMDSPDEAWAYDEMDHAEVNQVFVADLLVAAQGMLSTEAGQPADEDTADEDAWVDVLDLGTGTALQPTALCQQCAAVRVMAADAAISMLEVARNNLEIAGLTDRIQLEHVDAKCLPYPDGMFAITMSNSIVHHIPEPIQVLREAIRVTMPGGLLFFRDLLRPEDQQQLDRLVALYAGEANELQREMFRNSLHAALTISEMIQLVSELGIPPQAVTQTSDRHWTWQCRAPQATEKQGQHCGSRTWT